MEQKQAIADRLKQSNNILVTVSNNPSVDQLSACIGLTLALNKLGKHATAVFSGTVPSTLEFLQPDKTIEKNTDSLRDFIIALDKAKADKLRYKVEDKVVKIFITPYKTSITDKDLDFSQGDFNVDVVVALGVHQQNELDQAITAHGRILHDAVVAAINTKPGGDLGTVNWMDTTASSLSELTVQLIDAIDKQVMDGQMATALLTGIVAETNRFSNEKTTPAVMSASAELMGFGANPMLVATKLQEPVAPPPPSPAAPVLPTAAHDEGAKLQGDQGKPESHPDDGTLEITHPAQNEEPWKPEEGHSNDNHEPEHHEEEKKEEYHPPEEPAKPEEIQPEPMPAAPAYQPSPELPKVEEDVPQIHIDEHGSLQGMEQINNHGGEPLLGGNTDPNKHMASSHMILQPPMGANNQMGGQMGGASMPEDEETSTDPLSLPAPDGSGFNGGNGGFGPSPAASANIAPPDMPYLPPSMTPGGSTPGTLSVPQGPDPMAADSQDNSATDDDDSNMVPPPAAPPQIVHPGGTPQAPAPAPDSMATPALPFAPATPGGETLSEIEADVNSPHIQPGTSFSPTTPVEPTMSAQPSYAPTIQPPAPGGPLFAGAPAPSTPPPYAPDLMPPLPTATAASDPQAAPAMPQLPQAPLPDNMAQPAVPAPSPSTDLASARDAVMQAIASQPETAVGPEPIQALNAQPLGTPLHEDPSVVAPMGPQPPINMDATSNPTFTLPDVDGAPATSGPSAPPASPPPMMPPSNLGQ
ncbi:MAG TPA: hypothetical protein VLF62_00920 [Candidatus Saccharimonadales bacterium]|nr:hypothetical protein [Candidatus Saccharimonadales bacterium]